MSYDTSIMIDSGGEYLAELEDVGNYTGNVSTMYYKAMPGLYPGGSKYNGHGEPDPCSGLPGISGLACGEAIGILDSGIKYMEDHATELRELNPSNGWGDYEGALGYLRDIRAAVVRHPKGVIGVNW